MPKSLENFAKMVSGIHPAAKVGALIAVAALALYAARAYQRSQEMAVYPDVE